MCSSATCVCMIFQVCLIAAYPFCFFVPSLVLQSFKDFPINSCRSMVVQCSLGLFWRTCTNCDVKRTGSCQKAARGFTASASTPSRTRLPRSFAWDLGHTTTQNDLLSHNYSPEYRYPNTATHAYCRLLSTCAEPGT